MQSIFGIFNEPYPSSDDPKRNLLSNIAISIFVVVFLAVFQPFGLREIVLPWHKLVPMYLGYGLVTFIILFMAERLIKPAFPKFFDEQEWNVGKNIVWGVFIIMLIGLGNLFYSSLLGFTGISGSTLLQFQLYTIAIAVFPVTLVTLLKRISYLHKNLKEVKKINQSLVKPVMPAASDPQLHFTSENGKETIVLTSDQFLYAESADNYTDIVYIENGIVRRALLRSSLKRFEEQIVSPFILKVHRTYLVNLRKVTSVTGNSQGYRLQFDGVDDSVPVARRSSLQVKQLLAMIHGS